MSQTPHTDEYQQAEQDNDEVYRRRYEGHLGGMTDDHFLDRMSQIGQEQRTWPPLGLSPESARRLWDLTHITIDATAYADDLPTVHNEDGSVNHRLNRALRDNPDLDAPQEPPPVPHERFTGERNPAVSEDYSPDVKDVHGISARTGGSISFGPPVERETSTQDINDLLAQGDTE